MRLTIKDRNSPAYYWRDGEFWCSHEEAYVEEPCCTSPDPDTGYISCGCHGQRSVVCPNPDCTGILDHEVDAILDGELINA